MKKLVCLFLCLVLMCGCQSPSISTNETLKIVVASDIHYFAKDLYKDCEWFEESMLYGDGKMVTYADEILDAFIQKMIELKPDLVVFTGDLSFNGEAQSHQELAKKLQQLKEHDIVVAVIPGNHDVDNIFAKGYGKDDYFDVEGTNAKDFKDIYKNLGYEAAMNQHKESLSYSLSLNDDYTLILLDSTAHELTGSTLDIGGYLSESTLSWLKTELEKTKKQGKKPFIAMHHNLAVHNELLNNGYTIKDNESIAQLFSDYQVPFVLSGHIHCQNIKQINGIYDIASSSLLDAPLQYGVIDINSQQMDYHCESLQISKNANDYFDTVARHKMEDMKEEKKLDVLVKANRYYFAGVISQHKEELESMEGYDQILNDNDFYKNYLLSMLKEEIDSTSLHLVFDDSNK